LSKSSGISSAPRAPAQRARLELLAALASSVFGGLAGGAIWCLLSLATESDMTLLIVPLSVALAFFLRWQGYVGQRGALCAVAATLLTFAYAQYLLAAARVAQLLGFPLRSTLFKMDLGLAWQVARANISAADVALLIVSCTIAAWLMMRTVNAPHHHPSP